MIMVALVVASVPVYMLDQVGLYAVLLLWLLVKGVNVGQLCRRRLLSRRRVRHGTSRPVRQPLDFRRS
jgi:hypothetical protein